MTVKLIHQIWLGKSQMPEQFRAYGSGWQQFFPDWEYRLWTDRDDYSWMQNRKLFDTAPTLSSRSDVLRFELLFTYGGMYVDTDFECLKPFAPLIEDLPLWFANENSDRTATAIAGADAEHEFWRFAVEWLPDWTKQCQLRKVDPLDSAEQTGPGFLTYISNQYSKMTGTILQKFPPSLFYPYSYDEPHRRNETFPDAVAAHHWAASWQSPSDKK